MVIYWVHLTVCMVCLILLVAGYYYCISRQQSIAKNVQLTLKTYDFAFLSQDFCAMKAMVS